MSGALEEAAPVSLGALLDLGYAVAVGVTVGEAADAARGALRGALDGKDGEALRLQAAGELARCRAVSRRCVVSRVQARVLGEALGIPEQEERA